MLHVRIKLESAPYAKRPEGNRVFTLSCYRSVINSTQSIKRDGGLRLPAVQSDLGPEKG